jgi:hypothetical protein
LPVEPAKVKPVEPAMIKPVEPALKIGFVEACLSMFPGMFNHDLYNTFSSSIVVSQISIPIFYELLS